MRNNQLKINKWEISSQAVMIMRVCTWNAPICKRYLRLPNVLRHRGDRYAWCCRGSYKPLDESHATLNRLVKMHAFLRRFESHLFHMTWKLHIAVSVNRWVVPLSFSAQSRWSIQCPAFHSQPFGCYEFTICNTVRCHICKCEHTCYCKITVCNCGKHVNRDREEKK